MLIGSRDARPAALRGSQADTASSAASVGPSLEAFPLTRKQPAGGGAARQDEAGCQRASPGLYSVSPEDTWEMRREEDRHNFRANWLLRT